MWNAALAELSDRIPSQINWMVSICPLVPAPMGQSDRAEEVWDQDMTALTNTLA